MTWRSLSLVCVLGLMGCPPDDPSETDTDTGDVDTSDVDTTDPDTSGTDVAGMNCHVLPSTLPAWAGDIEPSTLVTETAYTNDSGLGAVMTAAAAATEGPTTADLDVVGATVTVRDFNQGEDQGEISWFWVADTSGAIYVRLNFDDPSWDIKAGDIVDFTVTSVQNFNGTLQIGAISDLVVVSSNNPVHVIEGNGQPLSVATDVGKIHHLYGELVSHGTGCQDPNICFDFETMDGDTATSNLFRIRNDRLQTPLIKGDCIEIYAPMSSFNGQPQFNIGNFAWHRWYGNVNE